MQVITLDGYPVEPAASDVFVVVEIASPSDDDAIFQHMNLVSWKLLMYRALTQFAGLVGGSIGIDYIFLLGKYLVVRVEEQELLVFENSIANGIFELDFLGQPQLVSKMSVKYRGDYAKVEELISEMAAK